MKMMLILVAMAAGLGACEPADDPPSAVDPVVAKPAGACALESIGMCDAPDGITEIACPRRGCSICSRSHDQPGEGPKDSEHAVGCYAATGSICVCDCSQCP